MAPCILEGIVIDSGPEAVTGVLHGKTITLDVPVPRLDGHRVRIIVEPADEEAQQPEAILKPIATVPPGKTPLPATREAFLNAIDQRVEQARPNSKNSSSNEPDK